MTVSKSLRFQIMRRDGHTCRYCGGQPPDVALVVDHVIPVALGGRDEPTNLVTACRDCNSGKAASPPDASHIEQADERAIEWAAEMSRIAEETETERRSAEWFIEYWGEWQLTDGTNDLGLLPYPDNWRSSIELWLKHGLTRADIEHAIETSMGNSTVLNSGKFRYMAGICWRMLEQREDEARRRIGRTHP